MANLEHAEDDPQHVKMSGQIPGACAQKTAVELSTVVGGFVPEVSCSVPSFAAASELLSAPYSCLVMSTHRRHVALPPRYLNKKRSGLQGELEAELLKYSPRLEGVPVAYDHLRIVGQQGSIHDDSGYIHMDIQADFIIFQPTKGQRLLGKVNKLGVSHVGCLVHGCFNASIPRPNLVPVETWRDGGPRIGAELKFEVTALDADTAGVLLIRGKLERATVQELLAMAENSELGVSVNQLERQEPEPTEESTVEDSPKKKKKKKKIKEEVIEEELVQLDNYATPEPNRTEDDANSSEPGERKKKKKKKKDKIKEEATEEEIMQYDSNVTLEPNRTEIDVNCSEPGKKKKKKKEKIIKEEEEPVQISPPEIHASDSSGYLSDKPSKKRKHKTESQDVLPGLSQSSPKSKKRKRDIV
ncbi:DNA-directed RNA polymerase I subunit RPA43-like [Entelurus aequoreus]|uniref:DNA-directed RNA polymerase I subunit RPA43-like n=1 Tax=Entelurus aequoreus TaxID=161455 RepID=UPI002B1DA0A9|nr:DNA-directed RNA polymerase I subunit RPA43-like [Entelurus aequoreus]